MIDRLRISLNRIINPCLGLEEFFKLTADLGLGKVELRNDLAETGIIDSYSPEQVKDLLHRYGIKILTVNALQRFNLGSVRQELIEELKGLISLSVSIGCEAVVLCPNNEPNDPRDSARMYSETVEALKAFTPLFEESGLMGYVEPLGFRQSSLRSLPTAVRAIQESASNCYKIVHDTFHHHIGPDELNTLKYDYDVAYTGLIHMSGVEIDLPAGQYQDDHRTLIASGDKLKSRDQIDLIIRLGYEGDISFEPFAKSVQGMETEEMKKAINRSIDYIIKT